MTVQDLKQTNWVIFEAVVGSNLYGLNTATSDVDIKGLYKLPLQHLLKCNYQEQVTDERNDEVFYEVIRFLKLAQQANPNILELFYIPKEFVVHNSPEYKLIESYKDKFLTKNIKNSLGGYAIAQIKKARGHNKKIVNPLPKERKTPLDFCYIINDRGGVPLTEWLKEYRLNQEDFGLSNISTAHNVYLMYHNRDWYDFRGIIKDGSDELRMSSIPKEAKCGYRVLYFASENYSNYCKNYKEYWEWMDNRNESRYISVEKHNKGYDGKHLMHCFRLLNMGIDAAKYGTLIVKRPERKWLLDVREGIFEYEDLIKTAENSLHEMEELIGSSSLPDIVDQTVVDDLLLQLRGI